MNSMTWLRGKMQPLAGTDNYRPKFCRTRGCNLKFEHEGKHDVVLAKPGRAPSSRKRHGNPLVSGGGSSLPKLQIRGSVRHVNANPRGHAARLHMAQIRAGGVDRRVPPLPTVKAVSRRQQILARRAS